MTRIILVEPTDGSRSELERLLAGPGPFRLIEVARSYSDGAKAAARHDADLVVIGLDGDPTEAIRLVQAWARSGTPVLPASRSRDGELILGAIRAGAREFLTLPPTADELRAAIERVARPPEVAQQVTASRLVAVLGSAGGVGCTTLAVNLATGLAKDPAHEVVLVDFDLILGAVDACLDLVPDQTLADVAGCVDRLDPTLLKRSLTRHASGLYVLPGARSLDEAAKMDHEALRRVLEKLGETFPTVIVDLSKGLQTSDFAALEMAESVLLVIQLEPACLRNAVRMLELLRQCDGLAEKVKVVANRVGSSTCDIGPKKAEELLKVPVVWQIPNDTKVYTAARARGVPVETIAAGSQPHRVLAEIARAFGASEADRTRSRLGRFAASFF
jgi:pilus assembly protein CpaE